MLRVRGATRRFGRVEALGGVTFEVPRGRMTGFLGPNGAGKTTTMRVIMGTLAPDSGSVEWDGEPLDRARRRRFGYMPEERGVYTGMRVLDVVVYFARLYGVERAEARKRATQLLRRLGLGARLDSTVAELSHGNQQRVQLAVALVHDPDFLVLDEPFSGLDPVAMDLVATVLHELAEQGKAILFSSHQLDQVESLCDSVVVMNKGVVVLAGDLQELKRASGEQWLRVEVNGHAADWVEGLPGVQQVQRREAGEVRLLLEPGTDALAVLSAARSAGEIGAFGLDWPHLSELFRKAVPTWSE